MWMEVHIYSVKATNLADNMSQRYDNTKKPKPKDTLLGILTIYAYYWKI